MTTAVILAGGLGTRLRATVPDLPKPMAPINGYPFLEYQMDYWKQQGVTNFILSVGYKYQTIIEYFGENYRGIPVSYVVEQKPLGTGGGVLLATSNLTEPFLVLNGDTFFEVNLKELMDFHFKHQSEWTFALFRTSEVGRYMGMEVMQDGQIKQLQSDTKQVERLANGGVYFVNPSVLNHLQDSKENKISLEDNILPSILNLECKLYGIEQSGSFIDIGIREDYLRASEVLPKK